jgi:streptogramin lyase
MLTLVDGKVWYSQQSPGRVVELDPLVATGITATVTISSSAASPPCSTLQPQTPVAIAHNGGQTSENVTIYATLIDQAGWLINDMPAGSVPYGIAAARQVWLVDQGRQVLAKVSPSLSIYLPLIIKS